jgi:hypothetical protein
MAQLPYSVAIAIFAMSSPVVAQMTQLFWIVLPSVVEMQPDALMKMVGESITMRVAQHSKR